MKPIANNLIVKPEEPIKSSGNIVLPQAMWEQMNRGTVVAAGPKSTIKAGSQVAYMKDAGTAFDYNGEDVLFIKDEGIYAVL